MDIKYVGYTSPSCEFAIIETIYIIEYMQGISIYEYLGNDSYYMISNNKNEIIEYLNNYTDNIQDRT